MSKDCVLDSSAFIVIVSASVESESSLSISTCLGGSLCALESSMFFWNPQVPSFEMHVVAFL